MLKVHINKDTYANGETIKGHVILTLSSPLSLIINNNNYENNNNNDNQTSTDTNNKENINNNNTNPNNNNNNENENDNKKIIKLRVGGFEKALFYVPPNTDSYFSLPFYCNDVTVWRPKQGQKELEVGTHKFPFSIELPFHLAPSFSYIDTASICYGMYSFFDSNNNNGNNSNNNESDGEEEDGAEKGKEKDKKKKKKKEAPPVITEFFIYGTKKNKWKSIFSESTPATAKSCKASVFSKSKPVELSICIRHKDFMIGDKITIHAQVRNHSTSLLTSIQAQLIQTVRIDADTLQKHLGRDKINSISLPCSISLFDKSSPSHYLKLELPLPQVNGEQITFPSALGKVIRVDHFIIVSLPDADVQCTLPVYLWDEIINYSRDDSLPSEGTIDWETNWIHPWENDETVLKCSNCSTSFNVFNRKHHCRSCGLVFCAECTPYKETMKDLGYTEPVRICHACYATIPNPTSPVSSNPPYYQP